MTAKSKASPGVNAAGFDPARALDPRKALVPAVARVNEERVARGFWPKMRKVAAKIPFAADALSVWYCARGPDPPAAAKGMMLAALAYFIVPTDFIPDVIPALGFTDDAAVMAAVMAIVGRNLKPQHRDAAREALERLARDG